MNTDYLEHPSIEEAAGRAFALIGQMSFERESGTAGELKAANMLLDRLERLGVKGRLEAFDHPWGAVKNVALTDVDTGERYPCAGYELSAATPPGGLEAELLYVERLQPMLLARAKGKIVLFEGGLGPEAYRLLLEAGAAGFISIAGHFADDLPLPRRSLRGAQLAMPRIPGVHVHTRDAIRLVAAGTRRVRIDLALEEGVRQSHNVVADVPGTRWPEEIIAVTAHYDTVPGVLGCYDNASGTAVALELLGAFAARPAGRTLRFIWCGSEETGLQGSLAYTEAHAEELKSIGLVINFDLAGAVLGEENAIVMAEPALEDYLRYMARELGIPLRVSTSVVPGDCTRFVDKGVPAVGFGRYGNDMTTAMHDRRDTAAFLSAAALRGTIFFSHAFARRMADARSLPVSREIPQSLREKITTYLLGEKPRIG